MKSIKSPVGTTATAAAEIRKIAVNFYKELCHADITDPQCREELLTELSKVRPKEEETKDWLLQYSSSPLGELQALTDSQMDFTNISDKQRKQIFMMFLNTLHIMGNYPPVEHQCFYHSFQKSHFGVLETVTLLCTDYQILSKYLSNRLKDHTEKCKLDTLCAT